MNPNLKMQGITKKGCFPMRNTIKIKAILRIVGIIALVALVMFPAVACKGKLTASASSNLDKIIDDYEKVIDEFVAVYKKVASGDAAAITEMDKIEAKMKSIENQLLAIDLEKASPAQKKRMEKKAEELTKSMGL